MSLFSLIRRHPLSRCSVFFSRMPLGRVAFIARFNFASSYLLSLEPQIIYFTNRKVTPFGLAVFVMGRRDSGDVGVTDREQHCGFQGRSSTCLSSVASAAEMAP